jgi:protein-S-isoprenylcysteine O-methyltransferase Ste14
MTWNTLTPEVASLWSGRLWGLLMLVWIVLWFGMKKAKKRERWIERAEYSLLLVFGFFLVFGGPSIWSPLNTRLLPSTPDVLWTGLAATAIGIGISIWARLSLGSNWSGTVTLKDNHELVRKGLYRWVRHPIYSGILLGAVGSAIIKGHVRGFIGVLIILLSFYIKARREERFLREEFGAGFDEHSRQTGMFLPKLT